MFPILNCFADKVIWDFKMQNRSLFHLWSVYISPHKPNMKQTIFSASLQHHEVSDRRTVLGSL